MTESLIDLVDTSDTLNMSDTSGISDTSGVSSVSGVPDIDPPNIMADEIDKLSEVKLRSPYTNLVLSGGSTRGISQLGALKQLIRHNLIDFNRLKCVVGVSVGSLIACLIALKFSIDQIWDSIMKKDLVRLLNVDFNLLVTHYGVETGKNIYKIMEGILTKTTKIHRITFKQLYEFTGVHLIVVGSCLTTKGPVYFDHINYPNFVVSVALRISISIPGLFVPVVIDGKKYIDGGITDNYPMHLFDKDLDSNSNSNSNVNDTIGIVVSNECETNFDCLEQYVMAIMNLFLHNFYYNLDSKYTKSTINIKKVLKQVNTFNFSVDDITKKELFKIGEESTLEFIKEHIPMTLIREDPFGSN